MVVDDASSDGGADLVERVMGSTSVPMLLARKALNTGLADARNIGLSLSRGRQVFVLDADNWIYPSCLAVLQDALDGTAWRPPMGSSRASTTRRGEGLDLVSSLDWSPRRLLEGPYIDAMALLDRQAVLDVGGYSTELIDYGWFGWEDYDLWLKLAQAGQVVPPGAAHRRGLSRPRRVDACAAPTAVRSAWRATSQTKFADAAAPAPGTRHALRVPGRRSRVDHARTGRDPATARAHDGARTSACRRLQLEELAGHGAAARGAGLVREERPNVGPNFSSGTTCRN